MLHNRSTITSAWPWLLIIAVMVLGSVLGACAPAPAATPTPTKTPRPADVEPTATPQPTVAPPATEAPPATAEPSPTMAPTAAAEATSSPTAKPAQATQAVTAKDLMASPDFGVQGFLWWREEVAERDLQLMKDAGFTWVKQWFSWQDIEGAGKGQFDWTRTDRIVEQVQKAGLKLIVRVSEDPDRAFWAGKPPANAANFAAFLTAVARRYAGRIQAYQIWNEPNLAREWGGNRPDPAGYARMLKLAYSAVKGADPNAIVVTAGMAPTGTDNEIAMPDIKFYEQLYKAMGSSSAGYFDMLGVHAAGYAAPPEVSPDETAGNKALYGGERFFSFRHVEDVRALMVRYGDTAKRVVVLEFGWTTDNRTDSPYYWHGAGAGIDEALKGQYLVRAYKYAAQNWRPWIALMSVIYMPDVNWTKDTEQYYWAIIGPGYPDLYLRNAFVDLCSYIQGTKGQRCKYDPAQSQ